LGIHYAYGLGVPKDAAEANRWFRLAASAGDALAQTQLGFQYLLGEGAPQDDDEAATWIRRAAENGYPDAQLQLGRMYRLGLGMPVDLVQAYLWSDLAEDSFPVSNLDGRGNARAQRSFVRDQMTRAQFDEAQRLVRERRR